MNLCEELDIYTFHNKTLAERLYEYSSILSLHGKIPAKNIQAEWSNDVELVIESSGWQALWKISRYTCEEQNISYPAIVLVEVLKMKYHTLHAEVKIKAVTENINLPEKYEVPLIELYPTINQKDHTLDIEGTAHCVDRLRFFYNHLWMPWDENEDENIDWVERHLDQRIRLFFNMTHAVIDKETCNIIKSLINEGKEIKFKLPTIQKELFDEKWNDKKESEDYLELESTYNQFCFRLQQIKTEMDLLEVFSLKELLRKNQICNKERMKNYNKNGEKTYYFVWLGGTIKELHKLFNKIQEISSEDAVVKVCKYLEEALDVFKKKDTILLGEGCHSINCSNGLQEGGSIIGIRNANDTILQPSNFKSSIASLFDFFGTEVLLKNICIELIGPQTGIVVRRNCTVIVTGCIICVPNTTSSNCTFGAIVMPGGKLKFDNTVFQGLGTAVVLYSTGEVIMDECRFKKCDNGIKLQDNVHFTITKCSFENVKDPIVMETGKVTHSESVPVGHELFTSIEGIFLNECKFFTEDQVGKIKLRPKGIEGIID
ncbi:protein nessun dorma [Linepithema humile]|uniref:protein nessun dorma n=1 Tax=Linepithema humile TaxID=83485 RepID=UPI0006239295|nr:PREDICTED: SHC SH2 domain-binding protein 1 [Linepithema humile]